MTIKKWASSAPESQLVSIADANYASGFYYLGNNPPTAEEFNWLFRQITQGIIDVSRGWKSLNSYNVGEVIYSSDITNSMKFFECTVAGTSGTSEPVWGAVGTTIADGTVVWTARDVRDARKLQTARQINGVNFDGSEDINITQVNGKTIATTDQTQNVPSISILTGYVSAGGTIPLPNGYTQAQCYWVVSVRAHQVDDDDTLTCYADATTRAVTVYTGQRGNSGSANYIVIGVK